MKLTKQTDYALRILMYATLQPKGHLISIQEVTDVYDLSRNHIMKIVQKLGQEGYLVTVRGKGGGFRLGKPARAINLGGLVRLMEATLVPVNCDQPGCRMLPACKLRTVLADAVNAFMAVLDEYTLADLTENRIALLDVFSQPRVSQVQALTLE